MARFPQQNYKWWWGGQLERRDNLEIEVLGDVSVSSNVRIQ